MLEMLNALGDVMAVVAAIHLADTGAGSAARAAVAVAAAITT
jgi:hypothetical protein